MGFSILADAMVGALGGAGQGMYNDAMMEQQQQMQALRDQRLADLNIKTHAANAATDLANLPAQLAAKNAAAVDLEQQLSPLKLQDAKALADLKVDEANRMPYTQAPGSTRVTPGTPPTSSVPYNDTVGGEDTGAAPIPEGGTPTQYYTAPNKLSPEQIAEINARTDYFNSRTNKTDAQTAGYGSRTGGNWNQFDAQVQRLATQHLTTQDQYTGANIVDRQSLVALTSLASQYGRQNPDLSPAEAVEQAAQVVDEQRNIRAAAQAQATKEARAITFDNPDQQKAWIQSRSQNLAKMRINASQSQGSNYGTPNYGGSSFGGVATPDNSTDAAEGNASSPPDASVPVQPSSLQPGAGPRAGLYINQVIKGYRYKGGDPSKQSSWERAQ